MHAHQKRNLLTLVLITVLFLLLTGLFYLIGAFVAGEWNSAEWDALPKVMLVFFWLVAEAGMVSAIVHYRWIIIRSI